MTHKNNSIDRALDRAIDDAIAECLSKGPTGVDDVMAAVKRNSPMLVRRAVTEIGDRYVRRMLRRQLTAMTVGA